MTTTNYDALLQLVGDQKDLWNDFEAIFPNEKSLVAAALALGAEELGALSKEESTLARGAAGKAPSRSVVAKIRELIREGYDPLGEAFCALRAPEERRDQGATYTPAPIVRTMVDWASGRPAPARVVDPGVGSARFLVDAAKTFPKAELVGIDIDPLAALMARANLAVSGHADRSRIVLGDFRRFSDQVDGRTLYIGNPPYVRHHQITPKWKNWLFDEALELGFSASKLSGLHVYFYLATARSAKSKDYGAFITAAEWLDVNYGALVRSLILKNLGGQSVTVIEPTAQPFPDAATTAAITTFEIGAKPASVFFRRIDELKNLDSLGKGRKVHRDRLAVESRWSHLTRAPEKPPEGYVELGELCRVHRGTVTGANDVWIAGDHSQGLPDSVLFPTVTRAREVLDAGGLLADAARLKRVINLPPDLDMLDAAERKAVMKFLKIARAMGAPKGYIASHRRAWWSVGLRAAAPIISTYMARRPPAFVINKADARHINIAHGLYPRENLTEKVKKALVDYLQVNISQRSGRTYAGGLTKFEPREMERLIVPSPALLAAGITA
ncbi:Methyltransferase [Granulibacter bethesdensis]|uniref:Eco57I restriction-modification methylase domain-containing protein n=1 Tax=Granulibacter bethesdensis TaxID=364410 RepID=UPI00090CB798|nr:N-6 DNA methylase [Granulibacter bethesdensis]APH56984.1 Methyltransferase [Granulibacter bethesdensis]